YIVGAKSIHVSISGHADHAGTTPMNMRKDALVAASIIIKNIEEVARKSGNNTVATVGEMEVYPGSSNVIPDKVEFTIDIRSPESFLIRQVEDGINSIAEELAETREIKYKIKEKSSAEPVK